MPLDVFLALAGFSLVSSVTPGPNNIMLLTSGVNFGFRRTIPHMFGIGIGIGFGVLLLAVGFGLRACSHHVNSQPTALKKFRHSIGVNIWQTSPIAFQTSSKVLAPAFLR